MIAKTQFLSNCCARRLTKMIKWPFIGYVLAEKNTAAELRLFQ